MRRGLVHAIAWTLATGAAVTLSWWGVRTVMSGTVYDAPRAVPLPEGPEPLASSTARPRSPGPVPSAVKPPARTKPSGTPRATGQGGARDASKPARKPAPSGTPHSANTALSGSGSGPTHASSSVSVRSYSTEGGRAVLDLGPRTAALVSASPEPGWAMRVWEDPSWIRVEFSTGTRAVTVFCSWHNHPPLVKVIEN